MKRYRSTAARRPPRWWAPEPTYNLAGFEGQPLLTTGYAFRCPSCCDVPAKGCVTCGGSGQLALDDSRIHVVRVAA